MPFKNPPVAPTSDQEQDSFDDLDDMLMEGTLSASCGWVIEVGQTLKCRRTIRDMTARLRLHFPGRQALNWALLSVCVKEVFFDSVILLLRVGTNDYCIHS